MTPTQCEIAGAALCAVGGILIGMLLSRPKTDWNYCAVLAFVGVISFLLLGMLA